MLRGEDEEAPADRGDLRRVNVIISGCFRVRLKADPTP